jgi:hypothetical protein
MTTPSAALVCPMRSLAALLAVAAALARPALARPGGAAIDGTLDVSISSPALKHWGIAAVAAAFLPDADGSGDAQRVRAAADAGALCAALERAGGRDAALASVRVDGDGNLEHRSGDEMQLVFRIRLARLAAPVRGVMYVCSSPIVAVVARGGYPEERFERVATHRFRWVSRPLALAPGGEAHVLATVSIDASQW